MPICDYTYCRAPFAEAAATCPACGFPRDRSRLTDLSFLAQVAVCADMTWAEEKGMFTLRRKGIEAAYRDAGLADLRTDTAGFFPPQILNAIPATRGLEERIERMRALQWILPFLLMSARPANTRTGSGTLRFASSLP